MNKEEHRQRAEKARQEREREAQLDALRQIRDNPQATPGERLEAVKLLGTGRGIERQKGEPPSGPLFLYFTLELEKVPFAVPPGHAPPPRREGGYNNSFLCFRKSRFFFCGARSIGKGYPRRSPLGVPVTSEEGGLICPSFFMASETSILLCSLSVQLFFMCSKMCDFSSFALGSRSSLELSK